MLREHCSASRTTGSAASAVVAEFNRWGLRQLPVMLEHLAGIEVRPARRFLSSKATKRCASLALIRTDVEHRAVEGDVGPDRHSAVTLEGALRQSFPTCDVAARRDTASVQDDGLRVLPLRHR